MKNFKLLLFFWISSALIAVLGYYLLWLIMPDHRVFGTFYRMFLYHHEHPISYILVTCFFYGTFATLFSSSFVQSNIKTQWILITIIILLTMVFSSLIGGMLWHYHDMQAGFFPNDWLEKCIRKGSLMGLQIGWLIILLSFPYNILGVLVCFYLNKKGVELFKDQFRIDND